MDCPSPECREELKQEMADKCNKVTKCMNTGFGERLKTKTLLTIVTLFVIVSIAVGGGAAGWVYKGYSNAQDRQDARLTKHAEYREISKEHLNAVKTDVELIKKDIKAIKEQTYRNETIQMEMYKILKKIEPK